MNKRLSLILLPLLFCGLLGHESSAEEYPETNISLSEQSEIPPDTVISSERRGCFGDCPIYKVTIFADGTVTYNGENSFNESGIKQASISEDKLRELIREFGRIDYFKFQDAYGDGNEKACQELVTDSLSVTTTFTMQGKSKRVRHNYGCRGFPGETELINLENLLDEIVNTAQWISITNPTSILCQSAIYALRSLTQYLPLPERREDGSLPENIFDANEYFSVLEHLKIQDGYILDYYYFGELLGSEPLLYARPKNKEPYRSYSEYKQEHGELWESSHKYLDHIVIDDTPEGFFQFIALRVMGGQFYLFWHARYDDYRIICGSEVLEKILTTPDEFNKIIPVDIQQEARKLKVEPVVELTYDKARVEIVVFSKWKGFLRRKYTISRYFPHTILEEKSETLVPYNCGILF